MSIPKSLLMLGLFSPWIPALRALSLAVSSFRKARSSNNRETFSCGGSKCSISYRRFVIAWRLYPNPNKFFLYASNGIPHTASSLYNEHDLHLIQGCTISEDQVAVDNKFCTETPKICWHSVWQLNIFIPFGF